MFVLLVQFAAAATLPGLSVPFEEDDAQRWVLAQDLPSPLVAAGAAPGWVLTAVDDLAFEDATAVRRVVADGPARELRLRFEVPAADGGDPTETILVARRSPLVHANQVEVVPWPSGFGGPGSFADDGSGYPVLVDADGASWTLDTDGGALYKGGGAGDVLALSPVFWTLSRASWAIGRPDAVEVGTADWAATRLGASARVQQWRDGVADHLLLQTPDGLEVIEVAFPSGTPLLPSCNPRVPETCLTSGRQILGQLGDRAGAREEARSHLGVACAQGVQRACFEAVALDDENLAGQAGACVDDIDLASCTAVARDRFELDPTAPSDVVLGLLEFTCELEGAGTLGQRLRRLEDVGAGCMLLAQAFDARDLPDQALLALDRGCVLGRAEACEMATGRRDAAFAARTVRECEDEALPIAPSCVELGQLLQAGPVASSSLDDFGAFLRGCGLGDAEGCLALGDYVDRWGIDNPRVVDAERELRASCAQDEMRACLGAAHLLVRHEPRARAYGEALELFDQACSGGLGAACVAGAHQRRIGAARRLEVPDQSTMWGSACELHDPAGCSGWGARLSRDKNQLPGAFSAWTRACDLGDPHACSQLGQLVERPHEPAFEGEQAPALYLKRGCDHGDPVGCYWLAEGSLVKKGEPPEATYLLLEQSCEGTHGPGCASLASVHLSRKTAFDNEIAARHLDTACSNGHYESCKALGVMYLQGKGVERDRKKANELLERFRQNARRKHVRVGLNAGLPSVVGAEVELVAPIPVGPAISIAGQGTYLPGAGAVLVVLDGDGTPAQAPDLQVLGAVGRLYPNHQGRGLYGAAGFHTIKASGGSVRRDRVRTGASVRVGLRNDSNSLFGGMEIGFAQYGVVRLQDFDEDSEGGIIPLIVPALAFSVGFAVL